MRLYSGRVPAVDHSAFYPNETHDQVAAEIEDYINRLSDSDVWLRKTALFLSGRLIYD